MRRLGRLIALAIAVLAPAALAAQEGATVTGRVTNAQGSPEAGVSVRIEALGVGATTDAEGAYRLAVPASRVGTGTTAQITATRQGLATVTRGVTLAPGAALTQNFTLQAQVILLQDVVVSAMGVERDRSELGTAQQAVTSEDLNTTRTQSVVTQMQGKVAGVQITGGGTQGGSNNMVIRGSNSIAGNNQPLFIVDGVPVSNRNRGGGLSSGYDYGNAISDLNPEDIATVTVLKGPNAAALYGSRAANGAVVITTKKGASADGGIKTEVTTSYTLERPSILPDFQDRYGQGTSGNYFASSDQSWGPQLDGRLICQHDSPRDEAGACTPTPWVAHPDNVSNFFETGATSSTTVAVSGGTESANARLSFGYDNVSGYVPNNSFEKFSAALTGAVQMTDRLNVNATINYIRNTGVNRPGTGYNQSIMEQFFWFGRQVDIESLRDYERGGAVNGGPAAREFNWNYNYHNNPFWIQNANRIEDARDRLLVSGTASYSLADGVNATLRSGSDLYTFGAEQLYAPGYIGFTNPIYAGGFSFVDDYSNEHNSELLLTADRDVVPGLNVNALLGGGIRREYFRSRTQATNGLTVAGIYNVSNAAVTPTLGQSVSERHVNSAFGSLALTWNGWLTLEGTGRNDWSSTLPEGSNSYFYPSISTSAVITDALPSLRSDVLNFAKVRASIAQVGNDASPYQLRTTYTGVSQQFDGQAQFTLGDVLSNAALKPEITRSREVGVELEFMDSRFFVDATLYDESTRNQIFTVPVSPASGFSSQAVNAGLVTNHGFEALVGLTPVRNENGLSWTTTFNYGRNRSEVKELFPGTETFILGSGLFGDSRVEARVGKPLGAIYGNTFARDSATGKLLTQDGLPFSDGEFHYLGAVQPDWTGGWNNDFTWRNLSFGFLFDIRRGGKIVSYTNAVGEYSGVLEGSLRGREADFNNPGIVVDGIDTETGLPNTVNVSAEKYFQGYFPVIEPYVYDASFVKLREMRLGWDLPSRWTRRLGSGNVNVALTGRNLFTWTDVPNIDPEFAYSSGNFQGIEYAVPANPRSVGVTIRVNP
ncbi:SusC/RagA family TonB-linked outer membrane protein [Longimicrobium sp.]|uniref:SusC/RagA family TonB-linked outer membrane protein n=1 Tax=Longimicrobium sp. TaxID=2029185 RepID=UPI003B3B10E6